MRISLGFEKVLEKDQLHFYCFGLRCAQVLFKKRPARLTLCAKNSAALINSPYLYEAGFRVAVLGHV